MTPTERQEIAARLDGYLDALASVDGRFREHVMGALLLDQLQLAGLWQPAGPAASQMPGVFSPDSGGIGRSSTRPDPPGLGPLDHRSAWHQIDLGRARCIADFQLLAL